MDDRSFLSSLCDDIKGLASSISSYTVCLGPNERRADAYAQDIYDLASRILDYIDECECGDDEDDEEDDLT